MLLVSLIVVSIVFAAEMSEEDFQTWLTSNGMIEEDAEKLKGTVVLPCMHACLQPCPVFAGRRYVAILPSLNN